MHCIAMLGNGLPLGTMKTEKLGKDIERVTINLDLILDKEELDNENVLEGRRTETIRTSKR